MKTGVTINLISLISIVVFFELLKTNTWNPQLLIYEIIPLLLLIITYIKFAIKSGLWRIVHNTKNESAYKENLQRVNAVKISYIFYTIIISVILLFYSLSKITISMLLVASLIYFAHILPIYIMAWQNKNIE